MIDKILQHYNKPKYYNRIKNKLNIFKIKRKYSLRKSKEEILFENIQK